MTAAILRFPAERIRPLTPSRPRLLRAERMRARLRPLVANDMEAVWFASMVEMQRTNDRRLTALVENGVGMDDAGRFLRECGYVAGDTCDRPACARKIGARSKFAADGYQYCCGHCLVCDSPRVGNERKKEA